MDALAVFVAVTGLAASIILTVYAVKTYQREPPEEEILPWSPWY